MKTRLFTLLFTLISFAGFSQWVKLSTPTNSPLYSLSFMDASNGIVGGSGGTLLITANGGQTFETLSNAPREDFNCVYMVSTDVMFVGGDLLYRTMDGGETWTAVSDMTSPKSMSFSDELSGVCTSASGIYVTSDGGASWTEVGSSGTSVFESAQSFDDTDITMGNVGGMITYSCVGRRTDANQWYDFDVFSFPNSYAWVSSYFPTPDTGYVFFNQFNRWVPSDHNQFLRLTNFELALDPFGMLAWFFTSEVINDNAPDYMTAVHFLDNNKGYASGEQGSVYYTSNGGVDWNVDYAGTQALTDMQFIDNNAGFVVGYDGTILKLDLTTNTSNPELSNSFRMFPNPASGTCLITDTQNASRIELISTSGQLIRTYNLNGVADLQVSLTGITPGIYMVKMTNKDNSTGTRKLIVR